MKKLNLKNQVSNDDEKLINVLKTSIGRELSEQFTENTLEKFLMVKAKQKIVYKPLKSPLYMMLVIGLILLVSVLLTYSSQIPLPNLGIGLENLFENISFQLDLWYTLYPMLLLLFIMSIIWVELGLLKFRNPFI